MKYTSKLLNALIAVDVQHWRGSAEDSNTESKDFLTKDQGRLGAAGSTHDTW